MTQAPLSSEEIEGLLRRVAESTVLPAQSSRRQLIQPSALRLQRSLWWGWLAPGAAALTVAALGFGLTHLAMGTDAGESAATASHAVKSSPTPTDSPQQPQWSRQERLDAIASKIRVLAESHDPSFDLVAINTATNALIVYRADSDPARMRSLYESALSGGVRVTYRRAVLSAQQQSALFPVITAEKRRLAHYGVRLTQSKESTPGGRYQIGYDPRYSVPVRSMLAPFELYGPGTVAFAADAPASLLIGTATGK